MRFTKEKCREAIFLEPGDEPIHSTGEVFITYPCVFNTVSLQLAMTPFLTELANAICDEEDVLYNFYISINDYCKIDNCIEGVTWGLYDEKTFQIGLNEDERENLYDRLNELCLLRYRKSCEEMLKL